MEGYYWNRVLKQRLTRRRALAGAGGAAAGSALLAACGGGGGGGKGGEQAASGSGLVVPIVDETKSMTRGGTYKSVLRTPPTLDPHNTGSHVTHVWMNYSTTVKLKPGYMQASSGDVEGEILESWEMSPDKLTMTAKITPNAHFTPLPPLNGRSVTMEDLIFSWNRYKSVSPRRAELANDLAPSAPIVSVSNPDEKTVVIKLNKPSATFLSALVGGVPGTWYIVPREAEGGLDLKGTMAGSGPWYLSEWVPTSKTTFKKNPGFKQDKRDVPYMDEVDFVDLADYSTQLAQFKVGAIHDTFGNWQPDDILPLKSDNPALEVTASTGYTPANDRAFFGYLPGSPFIDDRVRQAWAMCWDRDLFIEAAFNTQKFRDAGLPVETGYDVGLRGQSYAGWWIDPTSKDFGPNSRFFKYDPAEAKKLLQAAGVSVPVEHDVFYGTLASHVVSYGRHIMILQGMARDTGLWKPNNNELDYNSRWNAEFRNNKGKFVGQAWIYDTGESDPANDLFSHYHSSGSRYFGPQTPDATLDGMLEKMLQEFDTQKRMALAHDVLRYEGGKMYQPRPGGATTFRVTWPALRNRAVWQGDNQGRYLATLWLDQTKAPFKS